MDKKTVEQRFWDKVDVRDADECWNWKACIDTNGYGAFKFLGKKMSSHVVSFILTNGSVPAGSDVCHKCNNRPCCNPVHLYAGTRLENVMDAIRAGTQFIPKSQMVGMKNHRAILRDGDVFEIRSLLNSGMKPLEISRIYNVSERTIYNIKCGKYWSHL